MIDVLAAIAMPPLYGFLCWLVGHRLSHRLSFFCNWICGGVGCAITDIMNGLWLALIFASANIALAAFLWWLSRRKRKRAQAALGAKSRALRDALVRRAREAAKPRPVLRPVPGSVR
jgi:Flp pilus assembly protein TadB